MGIMCSLERRIDGLLMDRTCRACASLVCIRRRRTDLDADQTRHAAFGILDLVAVLYILQHHQPHTRSQNRCCNLANMPDGVGMRSGPLSAVGSPDPDNGRRQQAACLSCREAKQKCSKGIPW